MRCAGALAVCALLGACAPSMMGQRPEFAQRPAPKPGQNEIELLAGIEGILAIGGAGRRGCLGIVPSFGEAPSFVSIVWPSNANQVWISGRWAVENSTTGQIIAVGEKLSGGGGFSGGFDAASLRGYNRSLTRDLSLGCAGNGVLILNKDFARG